MRLQSALMKPKSAEKIKIKSISSVGYTNARCYLRKS